MTPHAPTSLNLSDGLRVSAFRTPHKVAAQQGERKLTFREVDRRATQVGNALRGLGLRTGDRVAIMLANVPEYVELYLGLARAGMVAVPISYRFLGNEVAFHCNDAEVRALIFGSEFSPQVESARADLKTAEHLLCVGTSEVDGPLDYEQQLRSASDEDPGVQVDEGSPFFIGYTSGTTGLPKGAVVSHRSRSLTLFAMAVEYGCYTPEDIGLATAPLYHGAGMAFALASVYFGGTLSLMKGFSPEAMLKTLADEKITNAFMIPTMFQALFGLPAETRWKYDLSNLRVWMSNAAPLAQATKEKIVAEWPHVRLFELYGSTEGSIVTTLRPADQLRKIQCVGHPFPLTDIKLLDDDGNEVAVGAVGELFSRSPMLFNGYYNQPEATAAAFRDGYFSAGDLATRDEENHFYIVDRKKDMILSGGVNVYPREVEELLFRHPQIADVAVIGLPDDYWGESVTAVIVVKPGETMAEQVVLSYVEGKLAGHKRPRSVIFVDQLPRNAAGKVLKRVLRDEHKTAKNPGAGSS